MADSQMPWGLDVLGDAIGEPAWRHRPSRYLVATDDRMIPPAAQRAMARRAGGTVTGTDATHSVYVSRPDAVADLVRQAAAGSPTSGIHARRLSRRAPAPQLPTPGARSAGACRASDEGSA